MQLRAEGRGLAVVELGDHLRRSLDAESKRGLSRRVNHPGVRPSSDLDHKGT
jgi:hypothetical protein